MAWVSVVAQVQSLAGGLLHAAGAAKKKKKKTKNFIAEKMHPSLQQINPFFFLFWAAPAAYESSQARG